MKKVGKILDKSQSLVQHDILGIYKNILFVGKTNEFASEVKKALSDRFNIFEIFHAKTDEKNTSDSFFSFPYSIEEEFSSKEIFEGLAKNLEPFKKRFDSIILSEFLPANLTSELEDPMIVGEANLKTIEDTVKKNLLAYQLAKKYLHTYGSVIQLVDYAHFSSESPKKIHNVVQNQNLHLGFLLADLKNLDYQQRIHTLLYDQIENEDDNEKYLKVVTKALVNWVYNRRAPEHNSFLHFKFKQETKKISILYK